MAKRILIVDDEEVIRVLMGRVFRARPEDIVMAKGTRPAIKELDANPFDLVLTDVRMPGGGGVEVARAAAAKGIPVIFMSGFADVPEVQAFVQCGTPLLKKPFDLNLLLATVDRQLALHRFFDKD
ncbi:MAG: response regulator [Planctomycetota bacterium]